ncbi:MAG: M48 family metallopeptidase, partial [Pirellulales bacterium]
MRMLRNWRRTHSLDASGEITAEGVVVAFTRKRIKNFYLRIERGQGHVKLSAPHTASDDEIRGVIDRRIAWIKRHQARLRASPPVKPLRYLSGETHQFLGEPLRLEVVERDRRGSKVERRGSTLTLSIRRRSRFDERERAVRNWYREQLKLLVPELIAKWEPVLGVRVAQWQLKQMRTRWGTCNIRARRVWLNVELAKFPPACLEYVVVHEMVHLLERRHNARFHAFMTRFLPDWRERKRTLGAGIGGHYKQGHADD